MVRVRHRNHHVNLSSFNGSSLDESFQGFITSISTLVKDDIAETALDCQRNIRALLGTDPYYLSLIRSGRYGEESDVVDLLTGSTLSSIGRDKSNMTRFFSMLEIPGAGRDEAILILQTYKNYGIKTVFEREWKAHFRNLHRGYYLEINPLVPAEYIKTMVARSRVKEVKLVKFGPQSSNAIDAMSGGHTESVGKVEFSISARRGEGIPILQSISNWLDRGNRSPNALIELSGDLSAIQFDELVVELDDHGTNRTLRMNSRVTQEFRIDLNERVALDTASGLPDFDSLAQFAASTAVDFRRIINIGDNLDEADAPTSSPAPRERTLVYEKNNPIGA